MLTPIWVSELGLCWDSGGCSHLGWVPGWTWWTLVIGLVLWMILGVTPDFVTDEAFIMLHMFCSFYRGELNGIDVHGIRVSCCSGKEKPDATSSSESSNSFLLSVELACLFNPFIQHGGMFLTDRTICPRLGSSLVAKASMRVSLSLIPVCAAANWKSAMYF